MEILTKYLCYNAVNCTRATIWPFVQCMYGVRWLFTKQKYRIKICKVYIVKDLNTQESMLQGKLPLALAVRPLTSRTFSYDISNVSAALA